MFNRKNDILIAPLVIHNRGILKSLYRKDFSIKDVAQRVMDEEEALSEVLEGILNKNDVLRYNCYKILVYLCEQYPEELYQK